MRKNILLKSIHIILALIVLPIDSAQALSPADFIGQGIYFYSRGASTCGLTNGSSGDDQPSDLSTSQADFVTKYHDVAEKLSIEYGIPWEAVISQGILESASGSSRFARERNNFFGLGAVDSNPDLAYSYNTPEDGWRGYFDFIKNNPRYRKHGVFQGEAITDPVVYIESIKSAGYATDPNYVSKLSGIIGTVNDLSTKNGWESSKSLSESHPEMLANAAINAAGENTTSSSDSSPVESNNCMNFASSTLSGGIVDIANQMGTWGTKYNACYIFGGGHGDSTEQLKEKINNHFAGSDGVDCSTFTRAVILIATGNDDGNYATSGYCTSDNFEHIPKSQAQPGDFAIGCGEHIEVIVAVNNDGSFNTVGSHEDGCGENYGASPGHYSGTENYVLRYKGGA